MNILGENKNGYIGLIMLLAVLVIMLVWMGYLWSHNWFGDGVVVPQVSDSQSQSGVTTSPATNPGDVSQQLNALRKDISNIQDKKDQEIYNELNK